MTEFCPRSIIFTIPGVPGVQVTAVQDNGAIDFTVDVVDSSAITGDLRGLFFQYNESKLGALQIINTDGLITGSKIAANSVIDLGNGDDMNGAASPFDVGINFGKQGIGHGDDISFPVQFTLTDSAHDLTLDDFAHLQFGARVTSTGAPGGPREGSEKIVTLAPAAPDAKDDAATSHEDNAITIFPLKNDISPDGHPLVITEVHQDPNSHGTVTIAADGQSLTYTPNKDYAGLNTDPNSVDDSFVYCVSDGNGGEDHATVNLHIIPVADPPDIKIDVLPWAPGDPIGEVKLHVTATTADIDGSETLTGFTLGALPGDVKVTSGPVVHSTIGVLDSASQDIQLSLPTDHTSNFDFAVTATSEEKPLAIGNGDPDTATNTVAKHIELDFNHNQQQDNFTEQGQSIWDTGDAFHIDEHPFVGPDIPLDASSLVPNPIFPFIPPVFKGTSEGHFKAGLQVDLHIDGGTIDAHIPFIITADTIYNKTTDTLLIHTGAELAPSGGFQTTGPEGNVNLKFILDFLDTLSLEDPLGLGIGVSKTFSLQPDPLQLLNVSSTSSDLPYKVPLPLGGTILFDWPHLSVHDMTQSANTISGENGSNNFIQLNVDVDQAAAQLFPLFEPIEAVLDPDPTSDSNFELLDLDVNGGANFIQKFILEALGLNGTITLEDGEQHPFGQDWIIPNASKVDGPDLGSAINFALSVTPNVMLHNTTSIGFNIGGQLGLLKNIPIPGSPSVFDKAITIPIASIPLADDMHFPLQFNGIVNDFSV